MIGTLDTEEIEELLKQTFVGHIGCYADGRSYVLPLSFAYDSGYVYMRSYEGKKIDIMRRNPNICFQVDHITDMSNWKSVIAWGEFEELTDNVERTKALKILINRKLPALSGVMTKFSSDWPFATENLNSIPGVVFRIYLSEKTGRFELNKNDYTFVL
jgi:nitroimidazol reductase NimA-like FMN-containing flavoprotein (pyridoxamine 5'-phosphate oxidase superfamily)